MRVVLAVLVAVVFTAPMFTNTPDVPQAAFRPTGIITEPDSTGFVTRMIEVVNTGDGVLSVTSVDGSCGCAGGSVQTNHVVKDSAAKLYLWINSRHFTDTVNHVDFTVASNAANSPTVFRITVTQPQDTTE